MNRKDGEKSEGKRGKKSKGRKNSERKSESEFLIRDEVEDSASNSTLREAVAVPGDPAPEESIGQIYSATNTGSANPSLLTEGSTEEYSSTPEAESRRFRTSRDNETPPEGEGARRRTMSGNSNEVFQPSFDSSTTEPELAGIMAANTQNDDSSAPNSPVISSVMGFTKKQWLTLMIFSLADFLGGIVYSLQAPFYPQEAEKKGATATEYGLVFGVFELTMFIASPIYGKYMAKLGARNVFNLGMFITGSCCIFFGLLDRVLDPTAFITLSFLTRIVEAVGNAAFATATFTIIAVEFPDSVATTFASLETFFGLGLIVGPTVGGGLFQVGGFFLPFVTVGSIIFVIAIIVAIFMPRPVEEKQTAGFGVLSILKIPGVAVAAFSIMVAASSIGFLSATLEPHIRQFELTPVFIGLIFILNGGVYALTAPFFGWLCDRTTRPKYITLCGSIFICIAFVMIGPAPFIPSKTYLWLTAVGLVVQGLGVGATFVSGFVSALRCAIDSGFPDNVSTYSVVSGMWSSILALGLFVGPSVGGVLMDIFGFRWGSVFVLCGGIITTLMVMMFIIYEERKPSTTTYITNQTETDPLLGSQVSIHTPTSSPEENRQMYGSTTESNA